MVFIPDVPNIYVISCAASNTILDLDGGSSNKGTACHSRSDQSENMNGFNQRWLIKKVQDSSDLYTFQNLRSGTYLDLSDGSKRNGTKIQGYTKALPKNAKNQQWKINPTGNGNYRIQNVAGGTYVDIENQEILTGFKIHAWESVNVMTQQWKFRPVSYEPSQIMEIVKKNRFTTQVKDKFIGFSADGLYISLCQKVIDDIYNKTGLKDTKFRNQIFDCDDYAFSAKAAVAKWGTENLHADDFGILFGIMYGRSAQGEPHAYNWYLNNNLDDLVFFEPQWGTHQDFSECEAYFGTF